MTVSGRASSSAPARDYAEDGLDAGPSLGLEQSVVWRGCASEGCSYWEEAPALRFGFELSPAFDVDLEDEARWTWYDSPTGTPT